MGEKYEEKDLTFAKIIKGDWPIYLLFIASIAIGLYLYPSLPEIMPRHWNARGEIDGYESKLFASLFLPLLNLITYIGLIVVPFIDPEKKNFAEFIGAYRLFRFVFHLFMMAMYVSSLLIGMGHSLDMSLVTNIGIGLLIVVIGLLMARFKHNYTIGIRVAWTLANEEVWEKTHKIAAPFWVGAGLVTIVGAFFGNPAGLITMFTALGVAAIIPTVYSYIIYKRIAKNRLR